MCSLFAGSVYFILSKADQSKLFCQTLIFEPTRNIRLTKMTTHPPSLCPPGLLLRQCQPAVPLLLHEDTICTRPRVAPGTHRLAPVFLCRATLHIVQAQQARGGTAVPVARDTV